MNTSIMYQGGSAGFFLYYYFLLSNKFNLPDNFNNNLSQQFSINLKNNPTLWKQFEVWPDSRKLIHKPGNNLLLICNPLFAPGMFDENSYISSNTFSILLYTDIHTQMRLAYEKRAYWFTDISKTKFKAENNEQNYIKRILSNYAIFNGIKVDPIIPQIIEHLNPNQVIHLQTFIKDQFIPRVANEAQLKFLSNWLDLHSNKAKRMLLV